MDEASRDIIKEGMAKKTADYERIERRTARQETKKQLPETQAIREKSAADFDELIKKLTTGGRRRRKSRRQRKSRSQRKSRRAR